MRAPGGGPPLLGSLRRVDAASAMRLRGFTVMVLALGLVGAVAAGWWWLGRGPGEPIRIGVVHSLSGPLATSEAPLLHGYRLAVEEINADGGLLGRPLQLVIRDGASDPSTFASEAERLLRDDEEGGVAVLAGGWASAARKSMLEVTERADGLLLYPARFEGLEASPHVYYLGVSPGQVLGPLVDWALARGARDVAIVGNDGVYSRMTGMIARDIIGMRGGTVVAEEFLPLVGGDPQATAQRLAAAQPDLIINTVHGAGSEGLMRAMRAVGLDPSQTTIVSTSLNEAEIRHWESGLFADTFVVGSYFRSLPTVANRAFLGAVRALAGDDAISTDAMVAAYLGLKLWAVAVEDVGATTPASVRRSLRGRHLDGPGGTIVIDPDSQYVWRPVRIGRVQIDGGIEVVWDSITTVPPRIWPIWRSRGEWQAELDRLSASWGGLWEAPAQVRPRRPRENPGPASGVPEPADSAPVPVAPAAGSDPP